MTSARHTPWERYISPEPNSEPRHAVISGFFRACVNATQSQSNLASRNESMRGEGSLLSDGDSRKSMDDDDFEEISRHVTWLSCH